nr:immunoglobulin light chain junction region [Macaca mulatta]
CFQEVQIPPTF